MAFVRFTTLERSHVTGLPMGPFLAAGELLMDPSFGGPERDELAEAHGWICANLPVPVRFGRTTSKGHYRRNARGICWFKDSATDCLVQVRRIVGVLERRGWIVQQVVETRIGYIVYEDAWQVVAEPFADTRTG